MREISRALRDALPLATKTASIDWEGLPFGDRSLALGRMAQE